MKWYNKIRKYLQKLIDDTLKTPEGKWSRTSLTMFFSFIFSLSYLSYELIINDNFYIEAFYALLATATGMKWLGDIDHHKTIKAKSESKPEFDESNR